MPTRRMFTGLLPLAAAALATLLAGPAAAQQKTEITFARFFGACEGDYGTSQDVAHARGECGVMTTLVNLFNATNKDNIVVKPQIIEWGAVLSAAECPHRGARHPNDRRHAHSPARRLHALRGTAG